MDILSFFDRREYTKCIACGQLIKADKFSETSERIGICKSCSAHLPIVPVGMTFQEQNSCIEYCMAVFFYRPPLREMIIDFKFKSCTAYGGLFAKYMYTYMCAFSDMADMVIPVPLSAERLNERGYNQAELLSTPLADMLNLPHPKDALIRIRATKRQSDLPAWERGTNIENAFSADESIIKNRSILLIDDVYTTGSTVTECAKTLSAAGAEKVKVLTLARQPGLRKSKEYNELLSQ